jgi:hypothetical protein
VEDERMNIIVGGQTDVMRLKFSSMDAATRALAKAFYKMYSPKKLALIAATAILRLTCYWSQNPINGEIYIRGSMLDDEELEF